MTALTTIDRDATSDSLTNPVKTLPLKQSTTTTTTTTTTSFLMKFLPHKRRSEEVKRTSFVLDDYANLLTRDSDFLSGDSTASSDSLNELASVQSVGTSLTRRPSVVSAPSVGSFQRQEVALGTLLGKGQFSKVYEITSIDLEEQEAAAHDADSVRARSTMSKNAKAGKYAMKRLRKKLLRRPRDFTKAAAHLVIEAQYLSKLDHPNILKLRGSALGGASSFQTGQHDGYFLILDRVNETLHERIHNTWAARRAGSTSTSTSTSSSNNNFSLPVEEAELMFQKTHYALQLASALHYLHDRRIIFRDLSPRNLGFTADHSLQLFDFGLARDLPQALGLSNELFHMTQNAGSKPYAAVEVATTGLYNLKADVYSFSLVVYEMMMEQIPFLHLAGKAKRPFANKEFVQAVYIDGERPSFEISNEDEKGAPPQELQDLLAKCWQADLFHRPTMEDVYFELECILESLPHKPTNLQLGMIPPAPMKVANMVLDAEHQHHLSMSDLSNGISV